MDHREAKKLVNMMKQNVKACFFLLSGFLCVVGGEQIVSVSVLSCPVRSGHVLYCIVLYCIVLYCTVM